MNSTFKREPWTHPELGRFDFDEDLAGWFREFELPGFHMFDFHQETAGLPVKVGFSMRYEMSTSIPMSPPPSAALELESLFEHLSALPERVAKAVFEAYKLHWALPDDEFALGNIDSPDSIVHHLKLDGIEVWFVPEETGLPTMRDPFTGETIVKTLVRPPRPGFWATELMFHCNFEGEHGLGVLTRRGHVLNVGYMGEVAPKDDYDPREVP